VGFAARSRRSIHCVEEQRRSVLQAVEQIVPCDDVEARHKADAIAWINSGAQLYRIAKPATPPKHLVTYFVLVDTEHESILLVDHLKAQKWLPTGGHVEPNEDPIATVKREVVEELGVPAKFLPAFGENPLFLTSATTVGLTAGHTDITLWYVLAGSKDDEFSYDSNEFRTIRWFTFADILGMDESTIDPRMRQFVRKLIRYSVT
jgi:8-oxo-dGTP pyrophosphatase MutT (NUDIX family)